MRHDATLRPVPATAPLHPRRQIEVEAWVHYIDKVLATPTEILPFAAARNFVRRLAQADAATIHRGQPEMTMQLLGITARTDGGEYALLRNWQTAALNRLKEAAA